MAQRVTCSTKGPNLPIPGRHVLTASRQMHNRGNGKGGGIAAVGLVPEQLGVSRQVLDEHYMLHVALLDRLFVVRLVILPVPLLDKLFVVLLVMVPVAPLRGLFVRLLLTLLIMLTVPLLFTWPSAPMSRSAIQARISRDENRLGKYCIPCAPLCKEIVSRKEERIMTRVQLTNE